MFITSDNLDKDPFSIAKTVDKQEIYFSKLIFVDILSCETHVIFSISIFLSFKLLNET